MYDLEKEPSELTNVYTDPAYADVKADLHMQLTKLREKYGDSDELDQKYPKAYPDHINKRRKRINA